jgi:aryl-alcohol dehydrogenase-like predicted oxidoreductase
MSPFNKIGFQMNPSREACELVARKTRNLDLIAMSILSSGMLGLDEALAYIKSFPEIRSVVVGASSEEHAKATFGALREL